MPKKTAAPLDALGGLLDDLRGALDRPEVSRLDASVRQYVERTLAAAIAAADRARHNNLEVDAAGQLRNTVVAARGLLGEMRGSKARASSIVDRSRRLRRRAVELSAAALLLRRQSERLLRPMWLATRSDGGVADLRGVRVLVVAGSGGAGEGLATSLRSRGAAVRTALSVAGALDAYLAVLPDVLLVDVGGGHNADLDSMRELRERGALAPTIAVVTAREGEVPRPVLPGCDAVLRAPVDQDQVTAAIAALLRR